MTGRHKALENQLLYEIMIDQKRVEENDDDFEISW